MLQYCYIFVCVTDHVAVLVYICLCHGTAVYSFDDDMILLYMTMWWYCYVYLTMPQYCYIFYDVTILLCVNIWLCPGKAVCLKPPRYCCILTIYATLPAENITWVAFNEKITFTFRPVWRAAWSEVSLTSTYIWLLNSFTPNNFHAIRIGFEEKFATKKLEECYFVI